MSKRARIILAVLLFVCGLPAVVLLFETWRARHDWRKCKAALEAKGEHLDMEYFEPARVPDDENFALTPLMEPMFELQIDPKTGAYDQRYPDSPVTQVNASVRADDRGFFPLSPNWETGESCDLKKVQDYFRQEPSKPALSGTPAEDVLKVLGRNDATLELLKQSLDTHSQCVYPLHYELGFAMPQPHLSVLQRIIRVLALRALAELAEHRPDDAFRDLEFAYRLIATTHSESTLIDGVVRTSMQRILMQPIWEGIASHQWSDPQLAALETQLQSWNFLEDYNRCMRMRRTNDNWICDRLLSDPSWADKMVAQNELPPARALVAVRYVHPLLISAIYRNEILMNTMMQDKFLTIVNPGGRTVDLSRAKAATDAAENISRTPYTLLALIIMPVYAHLHERFVQIQSWVNEASVACEIERYRLAHGALPPDLSALKNPALPVDVITGGPLHYVVTGDDYILYSVGWNGIDDGGKVGVQSYTPKRIDYLQGDWVWSLKPIVFKQP